MTDSKEWSLSLLNQTIFHGDLFWFILKYIGWDAKTISAFQQTCRSNRYWRSRDLEVLKDKWWKWILCMNEKNVGKVAVEKMKHGNGYDGSLCLNFHQLNATACYYLAPALGNLIALKSLDMDHNQIDATACYHLVSILPNMSALKILNFDNNYIDVHGCEVLLSALVRMSGLQDLYLWNNPIDVNYKRIMRSFLKKNAKRVDLHI